MSTPGPSPRGPLGTPLVFEDPCVMFAVRRESKEFRRLFRPTQRFKGAPCWASFCGPPWLSVLVMETGVGREATERALDWLLRAPVHGNVPYRPKAVLSAGFGGALQDHLQTGDVLVATEVLAEDGTRWPTTWPGELPTGRWDPPLHRGRLVTVPGLAATPTEKRNLGNRHGALVADMEGAVVAQRCQSAGISFGCVRVVLDETAKTLSPRLVPLLTGGGVSPWRLAVAILRSPGLIGELWRLGRLANQSAGPLGRALGELLTLTLPWMEDEDGTGPAIDVRQ